MPTLTIRNLDPEVVQALKIRALEHGRSMEAEARVLIGQAVENPVDNAGLASRIHARFADMSSDVEVSRSTEPSRAATFE